LAAALALRKRTSVSKNDMATPISKDQSTGWGTIGKLDWM
jgi:hypothetical protein